MTLVLAGLLGLGAPALAWAEEESATTAPAEAAAAVAETPAWQSAGIDTGSTAWLLASSALVLLMTPGLAMFYGGMVRTKNVLNMIFNNFVCMGVITLLWVGIGYSLAFSVPSALTVTGTGGATWSLLGFDQGLIFLNSFSSPDPASPNYFGRAVTSGDTVGAKSTGVPELAFMVFQCMFAIITPALIVGAIAERVKVSAWITFICLWSLLVYCPVAHWVWNVNGWLFQYGVMDFAGGTVVHVLAGISGLALCLLLGPRKGFRQTSMLPGNLVMTVIGSGLLWFGWFGFNAGSAIALPGADLPVAGGVAALAFVNTHIAAAVAALAWVIVEASHVRKATTLGLASGLVAGLVVITPCAGHVTPAASVIIGLLGGALAYGGVQLKSVFKYDDSLDAFGIHCVAGTVGALLVGVFAVRPVVGGLEQLGKQAIGVAVTGVYAFALTLAIGFVISKTIGFRVDSATEDEGLDVNVHGEEGYNVQPN